MYSWESTNKGLNGTVENLQTSFKWYYSESTSETCGGGCCSESNKWLIIMINGEYCIELNNWFQGTIVHETRFKLYRWESTNKGLNGTVVNRQVKRGGGVLLCIREGLNVQLRIDK